MGFDIQKIKRFLKDEACDAENIIEIKGEGHDTQPYLVIRLVQVTHGNYILTELQETYNCHFQFDNNGLTLRELKEDNETISTMDMSSHALMSDTDDDDEIREDEPPKNSTITKTQKRRAKPNNLYGVSEPPSTVSNTPLYVIIVVLFLAVILLAAFALQQHFNIKGPF